MSKNSLEVSAEHKEESKDKKKNHLSHISYRIMSLTENIITSQVKAKLSNNILNITLPKPTDSKQEIYLSTIVFLFNNLG